MERSEKRRLERERQKLQKRNLKEDAVNVEWYRQLPINKKIFLGKLYEAKIIENDNTIAMIMDKCILASMYDNTDLSMTLMKKIVKEYNDYILDYKEFLDKNGDGGMDMIENKEIREEVKEEMKGLINDSIEKIKGMAMLKKKYNLPGAELSELWIDCKVELDQEKKLKKTGMSDQEKKYVKDENKALVDFETEKLMCKPRPMNNTLEVIDEVKVVKGKYGYYHKSKDGIRFSNGEKLLNDDIIYENKKRVEEDFNKATNIYLDETKELNKRIAEFNENLKILNESYKTTANKFEELEQVFDL